MERLQNPWKDHPRSINPPQRANYPAEFKKLFEGPDAPRGGYMWIPPREPALLDYKDAIFILIGRSPNLGLSLCSHHPFIQEPELLSAVVQSGKSGIGVLGRVPASGWVSSSRRVA